MRLRVGVCVFVAVLCLGSGCLQDHSNLPVWRVGQWVRYDVTSRGRSWLVEYALVGREKNGGSQLFWLQVRRVYQSDSLFVKCLVPIGFDGPAKKMFVGGNRLSSSLSVDGSQFSWGAVKTPAVKGLKGVRALIEDVETPAGKFPSEKYDSAAGEIWLNSKVPLFGIVKTRSEDVEMVLVGYGLNGATSEVSEGFETEMITY